MGGGGGFRGVEIHPMGCSEERKNRDKRLNCPVREVATLHPSLHKILDPPAHVQALLVFADVVSENEVAGFRETLSIFDILLVSSVRRLCSRRLRALRRG